MKKIDLAYMAGIFDGEGSVSLHPRTNKPGQYYVTVQVTNTVQWLLASFRFSFGGRIYLQQREPQNCYQWKLSSQQAIGFLKVLLPYLKLKKAQAEVAIQFQNGLRYDRGKVTDSQAILRQAQAVLIKKLKKSQYSVDDAMVALEKAKESNKTNNTNQLTLF